MKDLRFAMGAVMETQKPTEPVTAHSHFQSRGGDLVFAWLLGFMAVGVVAIAWQMISLFELRLAYAAVVGVVAALLSGLLLKLAWARLLAFGKWADEQQKTWQKPEQGEGEEAP